MGASSLPQNHHIQRLSRAGESLPLEWISAQLFYEKGTHLFSIFAGPVVIATAEKISASPFHYRDGAKISASPFRCLFDALR